MLTAIRSKLTYANVMATVAVFLALGGGAYAALKLPPGSVGARQIARNAVSSAKVKNHSLLARDFRAGQLPAGARGPQGPAGPQGPQGPPGATGATFAFAHVNDNGTVNASTGVASVTKSLTSAGEYCFRLANTPSSAIASGDANQGTAVIAEPNITPGAEITSGDCPQGTTAIVKTTTGSSTLTDHAFFVMFER